MFTRLVLIMQQEGCVADHFKFELTPEPTSLFKDGLMRKPNKAILRNHLLDQVSPEIPASGRDCCIVDGGALLHKVNWVLESTFADVFQSYVEYVNRRYKRYNKIVIVFDGYFSDNSIKGDEHSRRGSKFVSSNITILSTGSTKVSTHRDMFLQNINNKSRFITLLMKQLADSGVDTIQSSGDTDVLIVETALDYAKHHDVTVSAQDTDILLLLLHHWSSNSNEIFFETERREKSVQLTKKWQVSKVAAKQPMLHYLLFAHAWSGSDSTSAIYRQGKKKSSSY